MSNAVLLSDVEAFIARCGMAPSLFGKRAVNDPSLVGQMRKGTPVGPKREAKIRAFMGEVEQAETPSPAANVADEVAAEASRSVQSRVNARKLSGTIGAKVEPRIAMTPAETIATMVAEDPADAVLALKRRWPGVWDAVILAARSHGILPGAMMVEAIETGLVAIAGRRQAA